MKHTPLYETHRALGARMVDFSGWAMPVQYRGIIEEHVAVRTRAGLFDVSHMGEIEVCGPEAAAACQFVTANDVSLLHDGAAQYTLLLLPSGGIVDDAIIYRRSATRFLFCVNAANREQALTHLRAHVRGPEVIDRSDEYALLALQGPYATRVLSRLTDVVLTSTPRFGFVEGQVADRRTLIAHTGYTGENGWEIYCAADEAPIVWQAIVTAGDSDGLLPAGLGARDTLRLEAALPLYGHELTSETTPWEARLGWVVRMDKGDFVGRAALEQQRQNGLRQCLVGLSLLEPGVPRAGYRILCNGTAVGTVTSGTKSPTLGKGIALGYVDPAYDKVGTPIAVEIRNRPVAGEIVRLPFYRRQDAGSSKDRNA